MRCPLTVLELFSGAGGASHGLLAAGLDVVRCIEWDQDADAVARAAGHPSVRGDVRSSEVYEGLPPIDALWGSPPCQAFSSAGSREAGHDDRNGWPWVLDTVDFLRWCGHPVRSVICENVGGMVTHRAAAHTDGKDRPAPDRMSCPRCYWDGWILPAFRARFPFVEWRELNAADYGVPQMRNRVFLVGGDQPLAWPEPTHSQEALVRGKWVTRAYWEGLGIAPVGEPSAAEVRILAKMKQASFVVPAAWGLKPWRTVRQALGLGLPIRHQSPSAGTIQRLPDDVSVSVSCKGTLYVEDQVVAGSDNPAYRSAARVTGGGANPRKPGEEHVRGERDLTDDVGTTVSANESGNGGMWIENVGSNGGWGAPPRRSVDDVSAVVTSSQGTGLALVGGAGLDGRGTVPQWHRPMDPDRPSDTVCGPGADGGGPRPPMVMDTDPTSVFDSPAPAVCAGDGGKGCGQWSADKDARARWEAGGRRRLTPRECATLQNFPEDYPIEACRTKTAQFKIVGNAVCPAVAEALGRALITTTHEHIRKTMSTA